MIKEKTLCLKDYRIIKVMLSGKKPLNCTEEIGLPAGEIAERIDRIKVTVPGLYKLKALQCNEM